jgi:hypothetical protein
MKSVVFLVLVLAFFSISFVSSACYDGVYKTSKSRVCGTIDGDHIDFSCSYGGELSWWDKEFPCGWGGCAGWAESSSSFTYPLSSTPKTIWVACYNDNPDYWTYANIVYRDVAYNPSVSSPPPVVNNPPVSSPPESSVPVGDSPLWRFSFLDKILIWIKDFFRDFGLGSLSGSSHSGSSGGGSR